MDKTPEEIKQLEKEIDENIAKGKENLKELGIETNFKRGCGKPEINSKTGNVSINCGDTLDEKINSETGETEFLCYYCQECKDKFDKNKK
jgi:hypothetical protein